MQFKYIGKDKSECVAYIDTKGLLRIRDNGRSETKKGAVCLTSNGEIKTGYKFDPEKATQRFYRGDSITLTF